MQWNSQRSNSAVTQNDVVADDATLSISTDGLQQPAKVDVGCVASQIVFNDLLTYAHFYRDRSTAENIKKVLLHFYTGKHIKWSYSREGMENQVYLCNEHISH